MLSPINWKLPKDKDSAIREKLHQDIDKLVPLLRDRQAKTRENRSLLPETISDLKKTGFFRVLQPKKYHGLELLPQDYCRIITQLAEGCMSTAWVCGVIGVHPFQLALFDERAQKEVWSDDPDCLVSSSYAPMGKVTKHKDGFMFSGRWGWSSGCDHCEWVLLGGIVPEEGYRTFLIPKKDYVIEDTWHVMGLQGTGSKDIVIADVFVPDYRTHKQIDGFTCNNPGGSNLYDNPMFRVPWGQIFVRAVSTAPIGGLRRAMAILIESLQRGNSSGDTGKLKGDPDVLQTLGETANVIHELEAILYQNFDLILEYVNNKEEIPMQLRVQSRYQASVVVQKCLDAINKLFSLAGGRSVFQFNEMQQILLDIRTSRAHIANNPVNFSRNLGNVLLDQENADLFV